MFEKPNNPGSSDSLGLSSRKLTENSALFSNDDIYDSNISSINYTDIVISNR